MGFLIVLRALLVLLFLWMKPIAGTGSWGGVSRKHAFFVSCFGSEKVMYGLMLPPATRAVGRPLHQLDSIASIAWDL